MTIHSPTGTLLGPQQDQRQQYLCPHPTSQDLPDRNRRDQNLPLGGNQLGNSRFQGSMRSQLMKSLLTQPHPRTMTDWNKEADKLLHECERNARYHMARRSFLETCHRVLMTAVLLSGSAAVATFIKDKDELIPIIVAMIIPTIIGAIEAVWNLSGAARDHASLTRTFHELSGTIAYGKPNEENLIEWRRRISSLYGEEPSVYHALNAECYNAATKALYRKEKPLYRIRWYQHILRNEPLAKL